MITASIVTYNSDKGELSTVLGCVCSSAVEQVWVVDNSPNNDLSEFVRAISPKIKYIFGQGNIGYGSAHNIAIRKSIKQGAKYHVAINPDIEFAEAVIEKLAAYMDSNPNIGQVMPKIIYPNGELQYLCKLLPSTMDLIGRRFVPIKSYVQKRNHRFEMRGSGYNKELNVPFLSGCFMFLKVDALEKVGGFDDHFFMYCEDIDLCRRIGQAGYATIYCPKVEVVHAHKKESFKSSSMLKAHMRSAIRYFNKWGWFFDGYRRKVNKKAISQYE